MTVNVDFEKSDYENNDLESRDPQLFREVQLICNFVGYNRDTLVVKTHSDEHTLDHDLMSTKLNLDDVENGDVKYIRITFEFIPLDKHSTLQENIERMNYFYTLKNQLTTLSKLPQNGDSWK